MAVTFDTPTTPNAIRYIHTDRLGTPQKVSHSITQAILWDRTAGPFGELETITGSLTNNLRFPGQYFDAESGYHYNLMRDYDPSTGRYLQSDPIGLAGGLNTYTYVGGNPVNAVDPRGQRAFSGSLGPAFNDETKTCGEVIQICILVVSMPGSCVYWCEGTGGNIAIQRNLGGVCPTIVRQPHWAMLYGIAISPPS